MTGRCMEPRDYTEHAATMDSIAQMFKCFGAALGCFLACAVGKPVKELAKKWARFLAKMSWVQSLHRTTGRGPPGWLALEALTSRRGGTRAHGHRPKTPREGNSRPRERRHNKPQPQELMALPFIWMISQEAAQAVPDRPSRPRQTLKSSPARRRRGSCRGAKVTLLLSETQ